MVDVSTQEGVEGSVNRLGESIRNVRDLARVLRRHDEHRKNGSHTSQPVLVRAGPGTGKTWMSKQAAYMLADELGETAESSAHKGVRMVPLIMYVQQIVYVLRDTEVPTVTDLLEVYLRKMYPTWQVELLLQAYQLRALIMIIDGVDEAAGMRQYISDFVLRVLVPSGNRILITSRREGISDLTPYIDLYFTVLDLKELSNEQQRSVIRAQMDGNEFFDHVLALGEMRRSLDGAWGTKFTARERRELEGFFCAPQGENQEVDGAVNAGGVGVGEPTEVLAGAIKAVVETSTEEGMEKPSFTLKPDSDIGGHALVCSTAALVIAVLQAFAQGVDIELASGESARVVMTAADNKFVDLDVTHFRFAKCTLIISVGAATLPDCILQVHQSDIKQAAGGEGTTASDHYAFFRTRMAHIASEDDKAIDRLLEPALIFLVDATGVPVLLSLLVLIFTSGGEDLSQLPKSQFELYQMGIRFAMDKRLLGSSQEGTAAAGSANERGTALAYDDAEVTAALTKRWNKLFALEKTAPQAAVASATPSSKKLKPDSSETADGGRGEPKKPKRERVRKKAEGLGLGSMEGGRSNTRDGKKEKGAIDTVTRFTDEDLYEIFRQGAKVLGAAARGVGRKELNNIELQMPKHLRTVVMTLLEANLKVLRDSSMHDIGLLMLRNLAILNQQNGRRQFSAGDVSQALLKQIPCPEALTLWLHLNNEEGGIPLTKTLEVQTDAAEGQYQFKHLSFQEGLFSQYLILQAQEALEPGHEPMAIWASDEAASQFLCDPFMNNTCRISAGILGSLLARRRPNWDFSAAPLSATGKRALWLLANDDLHELNLRKNRVGEDNDDTNEGLAKLINVATNLAVLRLGDNSLGNLADEDSGWRRQQISRALSSSVSIVELDISRNDLRPAGVAVMCMALRSLKTLVKLDISFNWPGRTRELPELLATHPALTSIGIVEEPPNVAWQRVAYLDSRAKERIGRTLLDRAVPTLGFIHCDAFTLDEHTTALNWKSTLEADAVLLAGALRANTVVRALNLGAAELRDDSKELIGNALLANDAGRVGLCDTYGLKPGLTTASYELNPKAKEQKDVIRNLKSFVLLCGVMRGNKSLVTLTLRSLRLQFCPVLARALRGNQSLQRLVLQFESDGKKSAIDVTLHVQELTGVHPVPKLDLTDGASGEINHVACTLVGLLMAENTSTDTLKINPGPGAEGGKVIDALDAAKGSALRALDLCGVGLGDRGGPSVFASLAGGKCANLTSLKLARNELNDRSLSALVEHLQTEQCSLTALDLSSNHISGKRFRELLMHNRTLCVLDIRDQDEHLADDEDWAMIGRLLLRNNYEGHLGCLRCPPFDLYEGLEELYASRADLGPGARALLFGILSFNTSVHTLHLEACGLDIEAAKQLGISMARNSSVTDLDISGNMQHLSTAWIDAIVAMIHSHTALATVKLDGEALHISELRGSTALESVNFASKAIGELSAHAIAKLVSSNTVLKELNLKSNELGSLRATVIIRGLTQTMSVTSLNLNDAHIGSMGLVADVVAFFAEVSKLKHLRTLVLSSNDLSDVPDSLCRLANLHVLNLQANRITKLPHAMGQLHQLRELTLQGNRLPRLPGSLTDCSQLELLDLRGNLLTQLPPGMGKLGKLRKLELARNKLATLPASMRDSPESMQIDLAGNNGLMTPPFALAKQGIQAIRRYFANEANAAASTSSTTSAVMMEEMGTPSIEVRKQKMLERGAPPPKAEGGSSRHNWVKMSESIVLLTNCFKAPFEVIEGDVGRLPSLESYEVMIVGNSSDSIGVVKAGDASFAERVELFNAWARAVRRDLSAEADEFLGGIILTQLFAKGEAVQPPVYLRIYPHAAYGCRIGARCELRSAHDAHEDDEESEAQTLGSVTVQEILDDDRCVVRLDNAENGRASTRAFGSTSVPSTLIIDLRPDTVVRTVAPLYKPGTKLIALVKNHCVDAVVRRCLSAEAKAGNKQQGASSKDLLQGASSKDLLQAAAEGTRHVLLIEEAPVRQADAGAGGQLDEGEEITLDLNKFNHCKQRQLASGDWLSWTRYCEARQLYCEALGQASSTMREVSSGKWIRTDLQEAECHLKVRGSRTAWSQVESLADIATVLTSPGQNRAFGVRSETRCILSVGRGFEQEWALRQCVCHLVQRVTHGIERQVDESSKSFVHKKSLDDAVQLVPLVISIKELVRTLKESPETTLASLLAERTLCEWYIDHCGLMDSTGAAGKDGSRDEDTRELEEAKRAMLHQAFEMRALVVILDYDEHFSDELGVSLSRFVHGELLPSGNRLLLLCRPESMAQSDLDELEEAFAILKLRALQLNLRGCGLMDFDGARFLNAVTGGSVFSTNVSALHLGDNKLVGFESGKILVELLKAKCPVQWLDLQGTHIDGRSLAYAIKMNATLTYLDVRNAPLWDDPVFQVVGGTLLEKGCVSQLQYLRCDDFDLLPGTSTLSLQETALGIGVFHLMAALLRRNIELKELDLTATDTDERGAAALAVALEDNTSLTRLTLTHNHLDEEAQTLVLSAVGRGLEVLM